MTLGEIISTSIAGVALIVACLARLDSKKSANAAQKSADAAQRANDLMARQLEFDKQKVKSASEPVFQWRDHSAAGVSLTERFQNLGGRVRIISCESNPPADRIDKPEYVDEKQEAAFTFAFLSKSGFPSIPQFDFTINYETQLNKKGSQRFNSNQPYKPIALN
ncbi:MAG: hypothetical protein ABSB84_01195 [Verrucomicrobiota bacterium]|jgi:hypothetical protein